MRCRCLLVMACCWALACGRQASGEPATAPAPATAPVSLLAAESDDEPATRPTVALIVIGADEQAVYRGWPISIRLQNFNPKETAPVAALSISGPAKVEPVAALHAAGVWLISAEKSKAMVPGAYVFSAGGVSAEIVMGDEPATLSQQQQAAKMQGRISYAAAAEDMAGAEDAAREWVKADPNNIEAQATFGDVLAGTGKLDEAQQAYTEAINRIPPGTRASAELYRRLGDIRRQLVAQMTTRPAEEPSADESAYYKIVAEGDTARDKMDDAAALRAYERAKKYHADKKLKASSRDLEEKIAFVRQRGAKPPVKPAMKPATKPTR